MFQPPKILIDDQEGGFDSYDAGIVLERCGVHRQQKPTDMHAAMVEIHNDLVGKLLHSFDGQTSLEGLPVTDQDIVSEACYAKNNMLKSVEFTQSLLYSALNLLYSLTLRIQA